MSGAKDVGANCFLNSPYKLKCYGPNPSTTRGEGIHVNLHVKDNSMLYTSGKFVIMKKIDDPSDSFVYRAHSTTATVVKASPNGYWLASGDITGKLRVWSFDNPEHLTKLEFPAFAGPIRDVDWDGESKKIVVVGDGCSKVITWDTGNTAGDMIGHSKRCLSCSFKATRPYRIMSCGEDFKVCFYQGPPFKMTHSRIPFTNFANCVRYSPNGSHVVCVGEKKIQCFDGVSGEETLSLPHAHEGTIYSVAWSADSSKFATASADKTVKIWNLALECLVIHTISSLIGDMQVGVLWGGPKLVSFSLNGNINFLSTEVPGPAAPPVHAHQTSVSCLCYDVGNGILYSGDNTGVLLSRNLATGVALRVTNELTEKSVSGAVHAGKITFLNIVGGHTLLSVGFDDKLRFLSLQHATSTVMDSEVVALHGQPNCIATLPASSIFFAVSTSTEVALFMNRKQVGQLSLPSSSSFSANCVALASESEVAVGCTDFKTRVYSISDDYAFTLLTSIETRSAVMALAYNPSCEHLAVGDNGRQVEVFARGTWSPLVTQVWSFHSSRVTCMAWSPSGAYLATGSVDECIIVWDFYSPLKKNIIPFAHSGGVTSLVWTDEENLVSSGNDHTIVTWKIPASSVV